jgi:uncharacterized protein (TIGR02246 family)
MRRLAARAGVMALMFAMTGAAWAKGESKKAQKQVTELQKFQSEYETAWNEGDFDTIKDMYSENAIFVSPEGDRTVGRDQIISGAEQMKTEGPLQGTTSEFRLQSVRPLGDEFALVTLNQEVSGLDPNMPSEYELVSVLQKDGGDWKIVDQRAFPSRELGIGGAGQECPPGTGGAGQEGVEEEWQIEELPEGLQQP